MLSKETNEKMDRTSDTRAAVVCIEDATVGELGSAVKKFQVSKLTEFEYAHAKETAYQKS